MESPRQRVAEQSKENKMADSATPDNESIMSSKSSENPNVRSLKETDINSALPTSPGRRSTIKGTFSPEITGRESSFSMDFDEYK